MLSTLQKIFFDCETLKKKGHNEALMCKLREYSIFLEGLQAKMGDELDPFFESTQDGIWNDVGGYVHDSLIKYRSLQDFSSKVKSTTLPLCSVIVPFSSTSSIKVPIVEGDIESSELEGPPPPKKQKVTHTPSSTTTELQQQPKLFHNSNNHNLNPSGGLSSHFQPHNVAQFNSNNTNNSFGGVHQNENNNGFTPPPSASSSGSSPFNATSGPKLLHNNYNFNHNSNSGGGGGASPLFSPSNNFQPHQHQPTEPKTIPMPTFAQITGRAGGAGGGYNRAAGPNLNMGSRKYGGLHNPPPRASVYAEEDQEEEEEKGAVTDFKTARDKLIQDEATKPPAARSKLGNSGPTRRAGLSRKFQSPLLGNKDKENQNQGGGGGSGGNKKATGGGNSEEVDPAFPEFLLNEDGTIPDRLKNLDPRLVETICNETLDRSPNVSFDDIAGLSFAKKRIEEVVVWPLLRPDVFTGLRAPPKGLLLFGPPGTGKTMIGKAIASMSASTFYNISSSSLMSKWIGDGEKLVRALFAVASCRQPSVIFIDEIDSLLTSRSEGENDAVRRVKTEFLVQFDGAATCAEDRVLVIGATNRPGELDNAALRRLSKRLLIPLPNDVGRRQLLLNVLKKEVHSIDTDQLTDIVTKSDGYSCSDLKMLCQEAALGPVRDLGDIRTASSENVRAISVNDFLGAFKMVRPSVEEKDLGVYSDWNKKHGSLDVNEETEH